jgi:dTDP-4-dehydrorhamnose 3,5-epimerase
MVAFVEILPRMARRLETSLEGIVLIEVGAHGDERGFLLESFREDEWRDLGVGVTFVQENHSRSSRGILRGIHFQTEPGQAKLVRCSRGAIWDVAVDLRRDSPTYRRWEGHELSDSNGHQLFVPAGFGHGFCVLSDEADVAYKLSSYYDPATEAGIAWDDPDVGIEWPIDGPVVSERDRSAPRLAEIERELPW